MKIRATESSFPLPLRQRNWSVFVLGGVATSAAVATWSFVIGGSVSSYVDAKMGIAAMMAGGLIGQFLLTLASSPWSTKYGIESVASTKPQLGIRGSALGLLALYGTVIGWNTVLMIFFGRSLAEVAIILHLVPEHSRDTVATIGAVAGIVIVWALVARGVKSLKAVGPAVALGLAAISIWLIYLVIHANGLPEIFSAAPRDPAPSRLQNYTTVIEILIASTFGWWGYMGGMMRMVDKARKTILPSMFGLGFSWIAVAMVSLFAGLTTGEPDPTIWVRDVAGNFGAVVIMVFIAMCNLSSALVGTYATTLAVKQTIPSSAKVRWGLVSAVVLTPPIFIIIFFPDPFFNNIDVFMAFLGVTIGPIVGLQIADWYVMRRGKTLQVSDLYIESKDSKYWYVNGFNLYGIASLLLGALTYLAILNPYTLIPNSNVFQYTTATLPAVFIAGLSYVIFMKFVYKPRNIIVKTTTSKEPNKQLQNADITQGE